MKVIKGKFFYIPYDGETPENIKDIVSACEQRLEFKYKKKNDFIIFTENELIKISKNSILDKYEIDICEYQKSQKISFETKHVLGKNSMELKLYYSYGCEEIEISSISFKEVVALIAIIKDKQQL